MKINFQLVIKLAEKAGDEVMKIYQTDVSVEKKGDNSPLTAADLASHNIIVKGLQALAPDVPILSEESKTISWTERQCWNRYWLIDPLDGTKEFINKNGEFTVNIALIEDNQPVWGVVVAPALETIYHGGTLTQKATKLKKNGYHEQLKLAQVPQEGECWKIVGSRSHSSSEFTAFIECFKQREIVPMGSSLKICLVAEGKAHLYPRLGPTSEWDTAAADAILRAAGGQCLQLPNLQSISYNTKEHILNPFFICCKSVSKHWKVAAQTF